MSNSTKPPVGPFNPFFGCAIMSIVVLMGIGGIVWVWHAGRVINQAIAQFAVDQPVELHPAKPDAAGEVVLNNKLTAFSKAVTDKQPATLALSITELNGLTALAPSTGYGDFSKMIAFKATKAGEALIADVCWTLNKSPFESGVRYAAGEAAFAVVIVPETGPDIKLTDLIVTGKVVSPDFIHSFSALSLLAPYHKHETLAPFMKAVKSVKITVTGIELSTQP